jgi:ATP-dependent RNA helicase DeaD
MLRNARIDAEWIDPPSPDQVRAKDRERLLSSLLAPVETDEEDRLLAEQLMAQLSPEAIASALIRSMRTRLPAPEDILATGREDNREPGPRAGFEGSTWFRINAGRRHKADPRWLLPLICRYGHSGRNDIGAIRFAANDSYFEVSQRAAPNFIRALRRATIAPEDEGLVIEQAEPRDAEPSGRPKSPPMARAHIKPKWQKKKAGKR